MIPVTVIGGYLGAGKTTLVNHLLRHADGRRLAVLINEFGALPIDADLIEGQDGDILTIAGGCICCSFGNDLVGALRDLTQLDPVPDQIVIEASGVAIPSAIAASVSLLPDYQLNAVVVLADVENVQARAEDPYLGDTILRQLQDADLVLTTKSDLVSDSTVSEVKLWLEGEAPRASVIAISQGRVSVDLVLGPYGNMPRAEPTQHADALFDSQVIEMSGSMHVSGLADALTQKDFGLHRAKGFLRDADGSVQLVQLVGKRIQVSRHQGPAPHLAIVLIGPRGRIDMDGLRNLFAELRVSSDEHDNR